MSGLGWGKYVKVLPERQELGSRWSDDAENTITSVSQVRKQRMKWLAQISTQPGFNSWQSDPGASATNLFCGHEEPWR